jgi:hypothetical protein
MKKLLVALAAVLVTAATYGQGQVNFQNFEALSDFSKGVYRPGGGNGVNGAGAGFTAGLFLVNGGAISATPLGTTTFFTDPGAEFLFNPVDVTLPTNPGGTTVNLVVRAWETAAGSYGASTIKGESAVFPQALGGDPGNGQPATPPSFLNAPGFVMTVPEPSTIAFGVIGGLALLLRRRK